MKLKTLKSRDADSAERQSKEFRTALRAYIADWIDTRAGKDYILARLSPEKRQQLREAQLAMVGKKKLKPGYQL